MAFQRREQGNRYVHRCKQGADALTETRNLPKETVFMNVFGGVIGILYFGVRLCRYR